MITRIYPAILLLFISFTSFSADIIITDDELNGGTTYNWTSDNVYYLNGLVYLEKGGILNIEPGTVIRAATNPNTGDSISALIITSGAQIFAEGTDKEPITFTYGQIDFGPVILFQLVEGLEKGKWGGLLILGQSKVNSTNEIFSLPAQGLFNGEDDRNFYGGGNSEHNSGILKYVSIQSAGASYEGTDIGGLTLAGVGRLTEIDFVEVVGSGDDGVRIYGGEARLEHINVAFCSDDAFDIRQGWNGKGQFWFSIQDSDSDMALEIDNPVFEGPIPRVEIYNATFIGSGKDDSSESNAFQFTNNVEGIIANSIIIDFPIRGFSLVESDDPFSVYTNILDKEFEFYNNIWYDFGVGNSLAEIVNVISENSNFDPSPLLERLTITGNEVVDPGIFGIGRSPASGELDPRAGATKAWSTIASQPVDNFFEPVGYKGAFGCTKNIWNNGPWTYLGQNGFISDLASEDFECVTIVVGPTGSGSLSVNCGENLNIEDCNNVKQQIDNSFENIDSSGCWCEENYQKLVFYSYEGEIIGREIDINPSGGASGSRTRVTSYPSDEIVIFDPFDVEPVEVGECVEPSLPRDGNDLPVVKIAIIDSGVELDESGMVFSHPWLEGLEYRSSEDSTFDGIDNNENCAVDDVHSYDYLVGDNHVIDIDDHGTPIAGIISNAFPSDLDLQIFNFKVYQEGGLLTDLICSIHHAIDLGVDIMNLSLGYYSKQPTGPLYDALKRAEEAGIIVVVSAGNRTVDNDKGIQQDQEDPEAPFGFRWPVFFTIFNSTVNDQEFNPLSNIINVAALDSSEQRLAPYSNYGSTTVHLAAAGSGIFSTSREGLLQQYWGTSMAAPNVVRAFALAKGYRPDIDMDFLFEAMRNSALPFEDSEETTIYGGKLNVPGFLKLLEIELPEPPPPYLDCENLNDSYVFTVPEGDCGHTVIDDSLNPNNWDLLCLDQTLTNSVNGSNTLEGHIFDFGLTQVTWTLRDHITGKTSTCAYEVRVDGFLPCNWAAPDDGLACPGNNINYDFDNEIFTLSATGCHIDSDLTSDQAVYAFTPLCGDGSISAQITNVTGQGYAGISMRSTSDTGSIKVELTWLGNPMPNNYQIRYEARLTENSNLISDQIPRPSATWLKIERQGNQILTYTSSSGPDNWVLMPIDHQTVNMPECVQVGLITFSYDRSPVIEAVFDNIIVEE